MEAKEFIKPVLENRGVVIKTSLDVKQAFNAAFWPSILHGLKELSCPRSLYNLRKGYFSHRIAVMTTDNVRIKRKGLSTRFMLRARLLECALQLY